MKFAYDFAKKIRKVDFSKISVSRIFFPINLVKSHPVTKIKMGSVGFWIKSSEEFLMKKKKKVG